MEQPANVPMWQPSAEEIQRMVVELRPLLAEFARRARLELAALRP